MEMVWLPKISLGTAHPRGGKWALEICAGIGVQETSRLRRRNLRLCSKNLTGQKLNHPISYPSYKYVSPGVTLLIFHRPRAIIKEFPREGAVGLKDVLFLSNKNILRARGLALSFYRLCKQPRATPHCSSFQHLSPCYWLWAWGVDRSLSGAGIVMSFCNASMPINAIK